MKYINIFRFCFSSLLAFNIYNYIKLYCSLCIYCFLILLLNFLFFFIRGLFLYLSISFFEYFS